MSESTLGMDKHNQDIDLDREIAFAKIVNSLVEVRPEKLKVLSDISPKAINGFSALLTWETYINNALKSLTPHDQTPLQTKIMNNFTNEYITLRVSKRRKGREEIIEALKSEKQNQEEEKGKLGNILPTTGV